MKRRLVMLLGGLLIGCGSSSGAGATGGDPADGNASDVTDAADAVAARADISDLDDALTAEDSNPTADASNDDAAPSEDVLAVEDSDGDTPVDEDITPPDDAGVPPEDVFGVDDVPAPEDVSPPSDVPTVEDATVPEDVPVLDDAPAPDDVPVLDDVPAPGDAPTLDDVPVPDDVPAPDDAGPDEVDQPTTAACRVDVTWSGVLGGETVTTTFSACLGFEQPLAFDCGFYLSALQTPGLTFGTVATTENCDLPELLVCRGLLGVDVNLTVDPPEPALDGNYVAAELAGRNALMGSASQACTSFNGSLDTRSLFEPCAIDNGGCSPDASCISGPAGVTCTCLSGFVGNGTTCAFDESTSITCDFDTGQVGGGPVDPSFCLRFTGPGAPTSCEEPILIQTTTQNIIVQGVAVSECDVSMPYVGECVGGVGAPDYLGIMDGPYRVAFHGSFIYGNFCYASFVPAAGPPDACVAENGGCDVNAACESSGGNATCTCIDGSIGDGTTCLPPVASPCDGEPSPCHEDAICYAQSGPRCACLPGFEGDGVTCTNPPTLACDYAAPGLGSFCTAWADVAPAEGCAVVSVGGVTATTVESCPVAQGLCSGTGLPPFSLTASAGSASAQTACTVILGGTWTPY